MATIGNFSAVRDGGFAGAGTSRLQSPAQRPSISPGAGNISAGRVFGGDGANSRSPLSAYGREFNFTQQELENAAISGAPALFGSRLNPSLLMLKEIQNKTNASPQLQGIADAIRAPFTDAYQQKSVPSGLLDSAVKTASAPASNGSSSIFGIPELSEYNMSSLVDVNQPMPRGMLATNENELYSSLPSVSALQGKPFENVMADYMGSQTMPYGPRVNPSVESGVSEVTFDGVQQSVLPDLAYGTPADSLASYGWMFDNPQLPIGMRNFNPGNLKYTGSNWQSNNLFGITGPSKYTDQGDPQIQFSDPVSGMASAVRLALAKQSQGMDTISKIITNENGWTPGNTAAANNIAKTMGVSPNQAINLQDPATMDRFMKALVLQEHGPSSSQYGQDVYNAGINVAFNAYGLGNPNLKNAVAQTAPAQTTTSGGILGGLRAETAPSPAPVQTAAPQDQARVAATPSLPPRTPTPSLLGRFATALTGIPGYDTGPGLLGGGFKPAEVGTQLLAGAQPQVVEAASAPEAPPAVRPAASPVSLASLLIDRAISRGEDRRRRNRMYTTVEQMQRDTIGGLLA